MVKSFIKKSGSMLVNDQGKAYHARVCLCSIYNDHLLFLHFLLANSSLLFICSQSNSVESHKCYDKLPNVNWLQHFDAHDKFACQKKFLCTNFLFSLEGQKPQGTMIAR